MVAILYSSTRAQSGISIKNKFCFIHDRRKTAGRSSFAERYCMDIDCHFENEVPVINIGADEGRLTNSNVNDMPLSPRAESILTVAGGGSLFAICDSVYGIR
jgi:hypothetical protein